MPDKELKTTPARLHGLHLEGRERLSVIGVEDVAGFDESTVLLRTAVGDLCIRGQELHVERIDLDAGQLELRGQIRELSYDEPSQGGFLSRLFG
jgi:sporulation protein YabP